VLSEQFSLLTLPEIFAHFLLSFGTLLESSALFTFILLVLRNSHIVDSWLHIPACDLFIAFEEQEVGIGI
jgi:hypothetical protein